MQASRVSKEEMGDRDGLKYVENPAGHEQLLSGGEAAQAHWPAPMVPIAKSSDNETDHSHDHEHPHDDHHEHHHKKSVLARVKEKAKKWRLTLTRKKHSHEDEGNTTSSPTINVDEGDEGIEQDPEYHGAPMYESEMAPRMYKARASQLHAAVPSTKTPETVLDHGPAPSIKVPQPLHPHEVDKEMTSQHQIPVPSIKTPNPTLHHSHDTETEPKLHRLNSFKETSTEHNLIAPETAHTLVTANKAKDSNSNKTLTETVTEMLAPAYNMVSDATSKIAAKIQSPTGRDESGAKMVWDKGVSVKEYLLQKLEPGEEEKALSEVITEAISPRKLGQGEETSVVEKVKGAMSSLLGKEEQMSTQQVQVEISSSSHPSSSPNSASERAYGGSRPLFKDTEGAPILASAFKDGTSILASKDTNEALTNIYAHGWLIQPPKCAHEASASASKDTNEASTNIYAHGSIQPHKYTHEASVSAAKDTHGASGYTHGVPSSGYTHGVSIVEPKRTDRASITFLEHGNESSIKDSEYTHEASMPASKGTHGASIPTSGDTHGISIPSSGYTYEASNPVSGYAHGAPITELKRIHGASDPTSEGTRTSIHASQCTHGGSIPASEYTHGTSILDSIHTCGDLSPPPVSTNPSLISASRNSSTVSVTTNQAMFQNSTNPHAEVEETSERRLQAHAN